MCEIDIYVIGNTVHQA